MFLAPQFLISVTTISSKNVPNVLYIHNPQSYDLVTPFQLFLRVQTDWSVTSRTYRNRSTRAYALLFVTVGRSMSGQVRMQTDAIGLDPQDQVGEARRKARQTSQAAQSARRRKTGRWLVGNPNALSRARPTGEPATEKLELWQREQFTRMKA